MCGRAYHTYTEEELAFKYMSRVPIRIPELRPNYNLTPTSEALILRLNPAGERVFHFHRFGLIPFWADSAKVSYKFINVRSETITEKPSFRDAYKKRRCVIPVSGFYEWKKEGKIKRPHAIHLRDLSIMSLAGIWEYWKKDGQEIYSFAIITRAANKFIEPLHHRMPVMLADHVLDSWLDASNPNPDHLLNPSINFILEAYEISTMVNSPRNNSKAILEHVGGNQYDVQ